MKQAAHIELDGRPSFLGAAIPVEQHPHDILDVNITEHVFFLAFKNRQARTLRRNEDAHHIVQRGVRTVTKCTSGRGTINSRTCI